MLMVLAPVSVMFAPDALAKSGSGSKSSKKTQEKYAALVVDVDTGKIIYSRYGKSRRYPASLTKMMTLYLTFDAVKHGKLKMNQKMTASAKAARQPSTNLHMSPGDKITVEEAIKALIIRSANDAAMIVAETLGKTQWNFAVMMNRKARELGMRNTVFRNPSGLPDPGQYSTAVDLAKLAIALRRDFPEYYHYFGLKEFEFAGRSYTTHNRVMLQYDGADGVKTGYINASGFNLVTSVKRDDYNIVAVVMGGRTSRSRDSEMVSLLDRSFVQLAKARKSNKHYAKLDMELTKPEPKKAAKVVATKDDDKNGVEMASLQPSAGELQGEGDKGEPVGKIPFKPARKDPAPQPVVKKEPAVTKAPAKVAKAQEPPPAAEEIVSTARDWGVQVGVYGNTQQAKAALQRTRQAAGNFLDGAKEGIVKKGAKKRSFFWARLVNLSKQNADNICRMMEKSPGGCLVIRVKSASSSGSGA